MKKKRSRKEEEEGGSGGGSVVGCPMLKLTPSCSNFPQDAVLTRILPERERERERE